MSRLRHPDMDVRTWTSEHGHPDMDVRTWASGLGCLNMAIRTQKTCLPKVCAPKIVERVQSRTLAGVLRSKLQVLPFWSS
jgi:hypothetical protein